MKTEELALLCRALGDPNRLEIVRQLSGGEKCGCKLVEALAITQPTLSHHMKILCDCGLVRARKQGKWNHYSLNCTQFRAFKACFAALTCHEEEACGC